MIVTATTAQGVLLAEADPEKLLRLPAHQKVAGLCLSEQAATDGTLAADMDRRKMQVLREINQRNLGYFEQKVEKLDDWADDLKLGLEQEIKGKLRRELFTRQDEVEAQRNDLITQLEVQLQQQVEEQTLFTIEWELA